MSLSCTVIFLNYYSSVCVVLHYCGFNFSLLVTNDVEYFLSEKGKSLMPILDKLCDWGEDQIKKSKN